MTEEEIVDAERNGYSARLARALRDSNLQLDEARKRIAFLESNSNVNSQYGPVFQKLAQNTESSNPDVKA